VGGGSGGSFWKKLEAFGSIWKNLEASGSFWKKQLNRGAADESAGIRASVVASFLDDFV
jgi:hypothetical protein